VDGDEGSMDGELHAAQVEVVKQQGQVVMQALGGGHMQAAHTLAHTLQPWTTPIITAHTWAGGIIH